jgi:hypothetical protein
MVLYVRGAEDSRGTVGIAGDHGWHPHLHVYLVVAEELDERTRTWLRERWADMVEREGLRRPSEAHGVDVRRAADDGAADYLAKLGLEVAGAERPRSPWAVLERALEGDRPSVRAWLDYARARRGRRRVTMSRSAAPWSQPDRERDRLQALRVELAVLRACELWRHHARDYDVAALHRISELRRDVRAELSRVRDVREERKRAGLSALALELACDRPDERGVVDARRVWRRIRATLDEGADRYEAGGVVALVAWVEQCGAGVSYCAPG